MQTEHELKLRSEFYLRVATGQKPFEIRKNDRDYQVGDRLIMREWQDGVGFVDNSETIIADVTYISTFNQQPGYVVMGIKLLSESKDESKA